ncbi:MAG: hypothetical protein GVY19_01125 [Bacteroidetes bacterium]|jgi:hypothetical protein|nr:hypothetical protein [Bacteroidota bacterium]
MDTGQLKQDLYNKIDSLNDARLKKAYAHMMQYFQYQMKEDGKVALLKLAGSISDNEAMKMLQIIESDCKIIDHYEW